MIQKIIKTLMALCILTVGGFMFYAAYLTADQITPTLPLANKFNIWFAVGITIALGALLSMFGGLGIYYIYKKQGEAE